MKEESKICVINKSTRHEDYQLFNITGRCESNELEIISFNIKTEEFIAKSLQIPKCLTSKEIRFVTLKKCNNANIQPINDASSTTTTTLIYILVDIGTNFFFLLDSSTMQISELPLISEISQSASLMRLNDYFLIALGGVNSSTICLYDITRNTWTNIGKCHSVRNGSYAVLNHEKGNVYICGGMNEDSDNSLDIETFPIIYDEVESTALSKTIYPCHVQEISMKNSFLLRKINPMILSLDESVYLICGGRNIFNRPTGTCSLFDLKENKIILPEAASPDAVETRNPNSIVYKHYLYFFNNEEEVLRFSLKSYDFESISKYKIGNSSRSSTCGSNS